MNDLTVIGTITVDRLHFGKKIIESLGGAPWFAVELSKSNNIKLGIVTNVGTNFPNSKFPKRILLSSRINKVGEETTTLDIFPDKKGVPASIKVFTGPILKASSLKGKVVIISPLLQEASIEFIKKLKSKFGTIIIDVQGFTRPAFKPDMNLSDDIKKEPKNLRQLCQIADVVKFSENEFEVVLPDMMFLKKLERLHSWGLKNIVVTMSGKGCLISSINSKPKTLPVKRIKATNIVGAGDKFLILLGEFLAKNNSLEESVIKAQSKLSTIMEAQL